MMFSKLLSKRTKFDSKLPKFEIQYEINEHLVLLSRGRESENP